MCNALTRLRKGRQIPGYSRELRAGHGNRSSVLGVGNAKMFLVNVHELDVVLAESVALGALENKVDNIGRVLCLERKDVLILRATKDFGERGKVDTESEVAVAAEGREGLGLEHHGDEGNVGIVHGLERDTGVIAVEVAVLNEIFDGIDDLIDMSECAT